jgi:hypothetical protein
MPTKQARTVALVLIRFLLDMLGGVTPVGQRGRRL